ncbi:MAG TPA: glutamate 5-kinase [Baekduia sp.]|uniref:glutamate 5-kinase n=1 Tax=Baekduia sp. TaxID=2600305 RepID=UPI002D765701|nr:glutamate 5-kinase [Baekduia sp.]HET6508951.1 glutamate 5-kinase [Baekduia sp.]
MARYVIKLGSGITASDDGALRAEVLEAICAEVAARRRAGDDVVVVSSGAIVRGLDTMGIAGRPSAIDDLQAASAIGQGRLFRFYDELLAARGVTAAQVLLTFFDLSHRTHYLNARQALRRLLDWGVVPIVNENDTTATDEITFGDNDFLAAQVAILVEADRLVLLTGVDGVYTADPRTDPDAEIVREITDFEELASRARIGESTSALGSGGMRSKVVAAEMSTAAGIPAAIVNGLRPGALPRVLDGAVDEGTHFPARDLGISSFKLWLRYAKPAHGTVTVDVGAARALREGGTSLLPVGVTGVSGDFAAGDAVTIHSAPDDRLLGKGIANLSAAELRRVRGLQSAEVREVLPHAAEEAVHRDYFVLA